MIHEFIWKIYLTTTLKHKWKEIYVAFSIFLEIFNVHGLVRMTLFSWKPVHPSTCVSSEWRFTRGRAKATIGAPGEALRCSPRKQWLTIDSSCGNRAADSLLVTQTNDHISHPMAVGVCMFVRHDKKNTHLFNLCAIGMRWVNYFGGLYYIYNGDKFSNLTSYY